MATKRSSKRWSRKVTETSNALDLEPKVFALRDPKAIARSLKRSADRSRRRQSSLFRSAIGNLVHNLHAYAWGRHNVEPFDWAIRFEERVRGLLLEGNHEPLITYESLGKDAMLSAPTPDHYLPMLYVLAVREEDDEVSFPVEGFDGGSVSMLSVVVAE
jgi:aromatic ring-opening dioxygenase catalytic subunit (LigB family)